MTKLDFIMKRLMYRLNTSIKTKHVSAFLKYNSIKKLKNLINVESGILLGKEKNFGYPYLLTVEPTNICNLKCPECFTGKGLAGRKKGFMPFADFKKVIDEIGKYLYIINFYNWGEPFLSKDIFNMIKYANKNRIYTSISTNGNYNTELNENILDSNLDHIIFALDGSNKEIYEKYRKGGNFGLIIRNIKDLIKKRGKKKFKKPFIEIQFLVFQHNKEDVENIKKLARKLKVDGLMIRAGNASNNKKIKEKYYTWGNKKGFCRRFWYCAIINCDGSLVPCCNFLYKKDDFGNVFESGFKEVWNNEIYQQNRKAIIEANIKNLNKVCKNCYKYHEN